MDRGDLRIRASQEFADLGPEPVDPDEYALGSKNDALPSRASPPSLTATHSNSVTRRSATGSTLRRGTCCSTQRANVMGIAHADFGDPRHESLSQDATPVTVPTTGMTLRSSESARGRKWGWRQQGQ